MGDSLKLGDCFGGEISNLIFLFFLLLLFNNGGYHEGCDTDSQGCYGFGGGSFFLFLLFLIILCSCSGYGFF